jgi:hypothetical protein
MGLKHQADAGEGKDEEENELGLPGEVRAGTGIYGVHRINRIADWRKQARG